MDLVFNEKHFHFSVQFRDNLLFFCMSYVYIDGSSSVDRINGSLLFPTNRQVQSDGILARVIVGSLKKGWKIWRVNIITNRKQQKSLIYSIGAKTTFWEQKQVNGDYFLIRSRDNLSSSILMLFYYYDVTIVSIWRGVE